MLVKQIATLDDVLHTHADVLGKDFTGYVNHVYRVVNLCVALCPGESAQVEKIAVAAAFHDLGIWTDHTFDYLQPSIGLACEYLAGAGRTGWTPEISRMIREHHKISRYRDNPNWLVEPFRQADWIDVSHGLVTFGLPRTFLRELFATWPDAGFHKCLVRLSLKRLQTHPWSPLPMVKL